MIYGAVRSRGHQGPQRSSNEEQPRFQAWSGEPINTTIPNLLKVTM